MKETKEFQTESKQLLNLMINSIYSNQEIFLRELLSNASDAIDKYKFLSIQDPSKYPLKDHSIRIAVNKKEGSISITDTGIGMDKDDMEKDLGTIAKSGSKDFVSKFSEMKKNKDLGIIGQFGVGFYSAFMVGNKVTVKSKKLDSTPLLFTSDGVDSYTIEDCDADGLSASGSIVTVYLKKDVEGQNYSGYLEDYKIEELVRKYSDYIKYPIKFLETKKEPDLDKDKKPIKDKYHDVTEDKTLNSMVPLWKKNKSEVTDKALADFYKTKFDDYEDPLISVYVKAEGLANYSALLFIPSHAPYNLYSENYEKGLALYSQGIFIQDKCKALIPDYLKFVKGLVDSEDFPLNISREMLQKSPAMDRISSAIEIKLLEKLKDLLKNDPKKYSDFFKEYGNYLKFGIYSTYGMKKDSLQDLLIYSDLRNEKDNTKKISLNDYVTAMGKDQKFIYYASGKTEDEIKMLPQMEAFRKNGKDVLFLDQDIDEFTLLSMRDYKQHEFKNIAEENTEISKDDKAKIDDLASKNKRILDDLTASLAGKVDGVSFSLDLAESPVAIATKAGVSMNMEHVMSKQPGATPEEAPKAKKVLEINPDSPIFKSMLGEGGNDERIKNYGPLLYEEARLLEGYEIEDKKSFVSSLNSLLGTGVVEAKPVEAKPVEAKPADSNK